MLIFQELILKIFEYSKVLMIAWTSPEAIQVEEAYLSFCGDKGISVGEGSKINIMRAKIHNSLIGFSVKDSSSLSLINGAIDEVSVCVSAFGKNKSFLVLN